MDTFKKIGKEILGPDHLKNPSSKSNQVYYLREILLHTVANYANKNSFTEQQFETAMHESASILDGFYDAFEPFRKCTGDDGDIWHHQYIKVDNLLGPKKDVKPPVLSTNGLFEEYVDAYIENPAMHSKELTGLLLDVHFYNDTIALIEAVNADRRQLNIIKPSMPYLFTAMGLQLFRYLVVIFIGAVLHKNAPELLTPYAMTYFYWRYRVSQAEPAKEHLKAAVEYSIERYTFPKGIYNYEQLKTELRTAHEKYGVRHSATIYELVELLR